MNFYNLRLQHQRSKKYFDTYFLISEQRYKKEQKSAYFIINDAIKDIFPGYDLIYVSPCTEESVKNELGSDYMFKIEALV